MKVRTQKNLLFDTNEIVHGISIMIDGGKRYSKYPIGHQSYKTKKKAKSARDAVQLFLDDGGAIEYSSKESVLPHKNEYVRLKDFKTIKG